MARGQAFKLFSLITIDLDASDTGPGQLDWGRLQYRTGAPAFHG